MNKQNEIKAILDHLYWFYDVDMSDQENQKDFKDSLDKLTALLTDEDEEGL